MVSNSIDQAVSLNKCFIIYGTTAKNYVVCRNTAQVVKLKVHVFQLLHVSIRDIKLMSRDRIFLSRDKSVDF